jgi:subtilisin family serine protease
MKYINKTIILLFVFTRVVISQINLSITSKLDPVLKTWFTQNPQNTAFSKKGADGQFLFNGFIQTENPLELDRYGARIRSVIGDIATVTIPMKQIQKITQLASIKRIQAATYCRMSLDISAEEIRVNQVRNGSLGVSYTGKDVIVGIVDTGIDWSHPDFLDENDSTRILFIWDQNETTVNPPVNFGYGNEYNRTQINDELDGSPEGLVKGLDVNGHGTHVAGIAAGNGKGTGNGQQSDVYIGMAPEADLIVVKGRDSDNLQIADTYIVDGINYIFRKADELGKPVVVNLSLGTQKGPHDGTSFFENSLSSMLQSQVGKSIVVAAGNYGNKPIHVLEEFQTPGDSIVITFQVSSNPSGRVDHLYFEGWMYSTLNITIVTPGNTRIGPVGNGSTLHWPSGPQSMVTIDNASTGQESNGDLKLALMISDIDNQPSIDNFETGTWKLILKNGWSRVDLWLYDRSIDAAIANPLDYSTLLVEPGNARHVLTVGSYISRINWPSLTGIWGPGGLNAGELSIFSGIGPTRPSSGGSGGLFKPEITAPGEFILSTLSENMITYLNDSYIASDSVHWANSGTSMAAPQVTGLVALMFQADPTLNYSKILAKLIDGARIDGLTGSVWNATWGYGKADAFETMLLLTECCPDLDPLPLTFKLKQNYPNPFNGITRIDFSLGQPALSVQLDVYDIMGRWITTLVNGPVDRGNHTVLWDGKNLQGNHVASGIYLYKFMTDRYSETKKMIYVR